MVALLCMPAESRFWCDSSFISKPSVCNQSKLLQDWVGLNEQNLVRTFVHFHTFFLYRNIGFVQSVVTLARLGGSRLWCEPSFFIKPYSQSCLSNERKFMFKSRDSHAV